MRYFYKLLEGIPVFAAVNTVMHQQKQIVDGEVLLRTAQAGMLPADTATAVQFAQLKKQALGIAQAVDGSVLGAVRVIRRDPRGTGALVLTDLYYSAYVLVLKGGARLIAQVGDEAVALHSGEVWWLDLGQDAQVINNGEDDALLLLVEVRIDR